MGRSTIWILAAMALVVAVAGPVVAQPKQGDVAFTVYSGSSAGMYYSTWPGSVRTLKSGMTLNAVKMSFGNYTGVASGGGTGNIYQFNSSGGYSTLTTVTPDGAGIALDQDGSYMVASYSNRTLYRVTGSAAVPWLTLPTTYGGANAICRDGNTGDWIVATFGGSSGAFLLRINRVTKGYSVITSFGTGGGCFGVDWIPQTGDYVVARYASTTRYVTWIRSNGSIRYNYGSTTRPFNCVTVDQKRGRVFAGTADGYLYEFSGSGAYRRAMATGKGNISGIDIWQDQNVSVQTMSNRLVRVQLKFYDSPSKSYYVGLSTSASSGVYLGAAGWVNLKPDPLLFLTVGGGAVNFTYRFVGALSSTGYASTVYFVMPYTPARVYVSAVAINPSKPGGVDVGNTEVVDIW